MDAYPTPQSLETLSACAASADDAPVSALPLTRKRSLASRLVSDAAALLFDLEDSCDEAEVCSAELGMRRARHADFLSSYGAPSARRACALLASKQGRTPAELLRIVLGPLLVPGFHVDIVRTRLSQAELLSSLCTRVSGKGQQPGVGYADICAAFERLPHKGGHAEVRLALAGILLPACEAVAECSLDTVFLAHGLVLAHCVRRGAVPVRRACRVQLYAAAMMLAFKFGEEVDVCIADTVRFLSAAQARVAASLAPPCAQEPMADAGLRQGAEGAPQPRVTPGAVLTTERRLFASAGWDMAAIATPMRLAAALLDELAVQGVVRTPQWMHSGASCLRPSALAALGDSDLLAKAKVAVLAEVNAHIRGQLRRDAQEHAPPAPFEALVCDAVGRALAAVLGAPRSSPRLSALVSAVFHAYSC